MNTNAIRTRVRNVNGDSIRFFAMRNPKKPIMHRTTYVQHQREAWHHNGRLS
ncbi:hypothetical protein SAMN05444170_1782 [Bradyrhizobium erythrophlei]|uniref:Uncharacterized protein n=1 Tax=Bradyrhizobium erythrophlei TaxID=1437360 RepID=A0A1M7TIQ9_9BRAD|nr:hypothetical protein SAMN05444170_1782 [Bradyrhizobium erythrophlei]